MVKAKLKATQSQAESGARRHTRRCPACKRHYAVDDLPPIERTLGISEHPLVAYVRTQDHQITDDGSLPLTDRFLSFLDREPTAYTVQRREIETLVLTFSDKHPLLALLLSASLSEDYSNRRMAEELSISDHTVAVILANGKRLLRVLARERGLLSA